MKEFSLSGSLRTESGKKVSKQLRKNEQIPAVIYGGEKNLNLTIAEKDLNDLIYTPDVFLINLEVDKKKYKAIVKDIQFHPVTDKILHLDFLEVFDDKKVVVELPIALTGSAIGVKQGGRLSWVRRHVKAYGFVKDLPEVINVDISDLIIGKSRLVSDLKSEGYEIVDAKSTVIAMVKTARAAKTAEGDDGDAEEGAADAAPEQATEAAE